MRVWLLYISNLVKFTKRFSISWEKGRRFLTPLAIARTNTSIILVLFCLSLRLGFLLEFHFLLRCRLLRTLSWDHSYLNQSINREMHVWSTLGTWTKCLQQIHYFRMFRTLTSYRKNMQWLKYTIPMGSNPFHSTSAPSTAQNGLYIILKFKDGPCHPNLVRLPLFTNPIRYDSFSAFGGISLVVERRIPNPKVERSTQITTVERIGGEIRSFLRNTFGQPASLDSSFWSASNLSLFALPSTSISIVARNDQCRYYTLLFNYLKFPAITNRSSFFISREMNIFESVSSSSHIYTCSLNHYYLLITTSVIKDPLTTMISA